jgi:diguanylate cyclase
MLQETNTLKTLAATFGSSAQEFRDDLSGLSQKVDTSTDRDSETEEILSSLVGTAHKAIEQNSKLEENLARAIAQITSLQESIGKIVSDANTDPLTKLYNRRYFDTVAPKLLASMRAEKKPLCFIVADIDHFRQFNDKWGHQIGDQVLKLVAHVLRENVKSQDLFARYGGNEFVLALPNKTLSGAAEFADNVRISIGKRKLVNKTTNDNLGRMTMSFGVVESLNSESPDELIKAADAAMSKAKEQGRDCVVS